MRALRNGEVDAIVGSGPNGDYVYTLNGADAAYRTMVQTMVEGAVTLTLDGIILYSNDQFASLLSIPLERVIGSSIQDFVHKDDAALISALLGGSAPRKAEIRLAKGAGFFRHAQVSANSLQLHGIECVCMIVTDLSQLRETELQYRLLVENIRDYAISMLDPQGLVISWTPAAERIKGYSAAEIIGKNFECFYTESEIESGHPQKVLESARLAGHFEEDAWRVRKDGSLFWANVMITAVIDESGQLRGFSKITRDISVRRGSEKKLQESEEKFRAVLDCSPGALVITDENGRLVLVNIEAEKLFGYTREELIGRQTKILIPANRRPGHSLHRADYRKAPRVREMGSNMELSAVRKNGEEFPVVVSLSPIETSLESWVAVGIRDITDSKNAETRLVAERQKAEYANRTKSDFLATMSHEIRTPMNAILGMAELLWDTELNQTQRDYVGRFRRAGTNLLTLINDILDLSKIESGRFELELVDFGLADLVDRTMELMAPRASAKQIALTAQIYIGTPATVKGDPVRLQQVLNNVIGNAIKFTAQGRVTLTVTNHADQKPGHLQFAVSDTGIGIPPDKLSAVFEDFTQAESSTTRRFGGTGLGLGICRRLVDRMGGNLALESVLGKGSTFTFDVVLALGAQPLRAKDGSASDLSGRRVLLIDDNTTNRVILRETCRSWGMLVQEAASAQVAYELVVEAVVSGSTFSVVLLNQIMPGTSGFEVLSKLLALDPTLSVVFTSSDNHPADMAKANEMGASGYITTPVRRADLLAMISATLFQVEPPIPHPADNPVQATQENLVGPNATKILIADDSEDNRYLISAYLNKEPYELTFVENGHEALETFSTHAFDLVLMDIQMPIMDGLEATVSIRALETQRGVPSIPILALSANARREDADLSHAAGCTTHVSKPISKERLIAAIESFRQRVALE